MKADIYIFPTDGDGVPGHYAARLARRAVEVPVLIQILCPWVEPADDVHVDDWCCPLDRSRLWVVRIKDARLAPPALRFADALGSWRYRMLTGRAISAADYDLLVKQQAWDAEHDPDAPSNRPYERVDLSTMPTLF